MPILKKCLCFTLRTGSFLIGVSNLILGLILLAVSGGALARWAQVADYLHKNEVDSGLITLIFAVTVTVLVVSVPVIISSSLLIYGVRKSKPLLLLPYVAVAIMEVLVILGFGAYGTGVLVKTGVHSTRIVFTVFILVTGVVENIHYAGVVFSYYQQLREGYRPTQTSSGQRPRDETPLDRL